MTPIRQMLPNIKFRKAEITDINFKKKNVELCQGFRRRLHNIDYDHLVIALGQESNQSIIPGLEHHSFTMRTLEDAYNVRNHLIGCFELADVTLDKKLKKRLLNIVVVGGGFSGVETIGELKEMSGRLLRYYKNISENELTSTKLAEDALPLNAPVKVVALTLVQESVLVDDVNVN